MRGVIYVEWDNYAEPPKPRYYGYGELDGKRVVVSGDIDDTGIQRRVRLTIRERVVQTESPSIADEEAR